MSLVRISAISSILSTTSGRVGTKTTSGFLTGALASGGAVLEGLGVLVWARTQPANAVNNIAAGKLRGIRAERRFMAVSAGVEQTCRVWVRVRDGCFDGPPYRPKVC